MRFKSGLALLFSASLTLSAWANPTVDLWMAIENGNLAEVKKSLDAGADFKTPSHGISPLMHAAMSKHVDIFKLLLAKGADIKEKDGDGETVLMWATTVGSLEMTKLLLDKGAVIKEKDAQGETPLMKAAASGELELVKFLLDKGADLKDKNNSGETLLIKAIQGGKADLVKFLIDKGFDTQEKTKDGETALMAAVHGGRVEIVKVLLEKENNLDQGQRDKLLQEAQQFATISSIKAKMYNLQVIVETYGVENEGVFPDNVNQLYTAASKGDKAYWKDVKNPLTQSTDLSGTVIDKSNYQPDPKYRGFIVYEAIGQPVSAYMIYGCDAEGKLIESDGEAFTLSNQDYH